MIKKRILGFFMIVTALSVGVYVGGWLLFIKPVIRLVQAVNIWKFDGTLMDILKICIFFPMLMTFVIPLIEMGSMFFHDKN